MIEQLARSSAEDLRTGTVGDVEAGLADLHVRQAQHRRRTTLGAVAAVVVALGVGWSAGSTLTRDSAEPTPTGPVPSAPIHNQGFGGDPCTMSRVTCLADGTVRVDLDRPIVWAPPPGFPAVSGSGPTSSMFESYREAGPTAGVTVLEHVQASAPTGTRPARGVADDPESFVKWVASRPYLDAGKVTRTTLDGREAWRVRVVLARGAGSGAAMCSGQFPCRAIAYQPGFGRTGIWSDMAAQYVAFRLPGGGTTVIWSWIFSGDRSHLGTLEESVHSITFPAR